LYGVTTFNLNKVVKRNRDQFLDDCIFQLSAGETAALIFQFGISNLEEEEVAEPHPIVFTEQGVEMLSSVLKSRRAIRVNIVGIRDY
jgi:ORF6N domain